MRVPAIACVLLGLMASPAPAQIGNPARVEPGTPMAAPGVPAPHHMNTQDRLFVLLVGSGNLAELELAKLADQRTKTEAVRQFAATMTKDHSDFAAKLDPLAKQANFSLPGEPNAEQKALKAELEKLDAGDFDRAYIQVQIVEHQKTVTLLQWEVAFGQDADLQKLAAATLPKVLTHLQMAQDTMSTLSGAGPQGANPRVARAKASDAAKAPAAR
jgi:putative membrane protein